MYHVNSPISGDTLFQGLGIYVVNLCLENSQIMSQMIKLTMFLLLLSWNNFTVIK